MILGFVVATVVSCVSVYSAASAAQDQPHMQYALSALEDAKSELASAKANKGGHRVKALEQVNQAIAEVKLGIEAASSTGNLPLEGALMPASPTGDQDQPHMEKALSSLQTAKSELASAKANKGGHRVKALSHVIQAISEVKAGMEYAEK